MLDYKPERITRQSVLFLPLTVALEVPLLSYRKHDRALTDAGS
jgi:hypothetical protein